MLMQRFITAMILAPLAIGGIFFLSPAYFALFIAGVVVLGAWEWANLAGYEQPLARWGYAAFVGAALYFVQWLPAALVLGVSGLWWALALYWVMTYPGTQEQWQSQRVRLGLGLLVLIPTWQALVLLRGSSLQVLPELSNLWIIFYIMSLVWGADVGAYFAGRRWGKKKLAPKVSPGKSWAGVWGGLTTIAVISLGASFVLALTPAMTAALLLVSLLTGAVSVLGDLLESMLKRHRGIKDSSQLLPGHGGVLDRIDSLTAAIPVFTLILLASGSFA